jgi:hypothetical protein
LKGSSGNDSGGGNKEDTPAVLAVLDLTVRVERNKRKALAFAAAVD